MKNPFPFDFSFTVITENNLWQMICKLKTKPSLGPDKITTILLKKIHVHLLKPLTFIINQPINQKIFPEKLKIAKITPVYKKCDKHQMTNYRPISILPVIPKLFEKAIYNQVHDFLQQNDLYNKNQYDLEKDILQNMQLLNWLIDVSLKWTMLIFH